VRHPAITIQISRIIARRVRDEVATKQRQSMPMLQSPPVPGLPDLGRNNLNLKTVAIVPVTRDVPISDFANRLQAAFEDTIGGPTAFLNQSSVMGVLGRHAFNRMGKLKLAGWLAEQEQRYRLVLYVVDTAVSSPWAQTSIRQADCVLLVGFGDDPTTGEYERLLLGIKTTARKELVLLHPERNVPPGATRAWLKVSAFREGPSGHRTDCLARSLGRGSRRTTTWSCPAFRARTRHRPVPWIPKPSRRCARSRPSSRRGCSATRARRAAQCPAVRTTSPTLLVWLGA
jgi:hypothetical protein